MSIASLTWTVYAGLKKQTPTPPAEVVARTVRVQLGAPGRLSIEQRDRRVDVTVEETIRVAEND